MIRLTFTESDRTQLQYERYHHPHPRVQQRMEALWLKSQDLPHQEIARWTGITLNTLRSYLRRYQQGGVVALRQLDFYRPQSELATCRDTLEEHFLEHPPASIPEARAVIERLTGIRRSPTQVGVFLRRLGLRRRKVGVLPAKADVEAQAAFQKKGCNPA